AGGYLVFDALEDRPHLRRKLEGIEVLVRGEGEQRLELLAGLVGLAEVEVAGPEELVSERLFILRGQLTRRREEPLQFLAGLLVVAIGEGILGDLEVGEGGRGQQEQRRPEKQVALSLFHAVALARLLSVRARLSTVGLTWGSRSPAGPRFRPRLGAGRSW